MGGVCHLCIGIKNLNQSYRLCAAAKDCFVCVFVNLADVSVTLVEASPIRRSPTAVSQTVADFHHRATTASVIFAVACLDCNCGHMLT